jgi:hypothetical protein
MPPKKKAEAAKDDGEKKTQIYKNLVKMPIKDIPPELSQPTTELIKENNEF